MVASPRPIVFRWRWPQHRRWLGWRAKRDVHRLVQIDEPRLRGRRLPVGGGRLRLLAGRRFVNEVWHENIEPVVAMPAGDIDSTGNRIGDVVVAVGRMGDQITTGTLHRTFQRTDLTDRPLMARQLDLLRVQHRQERIGVKLAFVLWCQFVTDTGFAHRQFREFTGIIVADDL